MKTRPPASCPVFASDLQARLLAALFADPQLWCSSVVLREELRTSPAALHDELVRLMEAGVIERRNERRPFGYRPNMSSPFAEPLKLLTDRSVGIAHRLRRILAEEDGVDAAGIFGSWARGEADLFSDIDVLVVGPVDFRTLVRAVRPLEREIQREINVVAYDQTELSARRDSAFLRRVRQQPIQDLVGDLQSTLVAA